jgi:hypothetical protein
MLYLAEIQKQKGGFIASGKAELKLLACQRTEQNWSAIQGWWPLPMKHRPMGLVYWF